jgi:3-hydroxyacyl-[acyl-carrier-protein] dehydratase
LPPHEPHYGLNDAFLDRRRLHSEDSRLEITAQQLLNILPHRYPFLLVDKILDIEEGKRVVALKNVTINEPFFVGHFPDHPIMPGVLLIEMMAQAGGVMLLLSEVHRGKLAYLAGVEKARFRKPVLPGDTLITEVEMVKTRSGIGWVKAITRVDDKVVCEAELSFAIVERGAVKI